EITSRAELLGAFDLQYQGNNFLVRVTEAPDGVQVSAVDPRGAPATGPAVEALMATLEAEVAGRCPLRRNAPLCGDCASRRGQRCRGQRSSSGNLPGLPSHSAASAAGSLRAVITGHSRESSALSATNCSCPAGTSSSG